ncbi:MAG TPA: hypothetical protein VFZ59_21285 [Verrucomicrobiae bacterium]|nr:hypothetical protein [Verrucomicrobiae bacterium]
MRTIFNRMALLVGVGLIPLAAEAANVSKTTRVEHGQPVVLVSQKAVLWLEFLRDSRGAAVSEPEPDVRSCRAHYRYQLFDAATGSITNGQGTVEEILKVVGRTPAGQQVEDRGSRTGIDAGEFHLRWSEGTAGARSWIYYRTESPVRFVQQPQQMTFDAANAEVFRRYLAARNVQEFTAAQQTVQVIGPADFSGDLPNETPTTARIDWGRIKDGAFALKLIHLTAQQPYLIESSYDVKSGNWKVVHKFVPSTTEHEWSEPLGKDVDMAFYRIREGH